MVHLSDLEELLGSIKSRNITDYMREAMSCYMARAYRGCIVLSYIALFDDLLNKLEELSKVNKKAKTIFLAADKKKSDQQVYESFLIDQLSSKKLIPELDASFLETLRVLRNKSAHPSGHTPSAEEARFIFYEVISRFLSRPILSTTQLVDDILNKLKNEYLFPVANIQDIKIVVEEEIAPLHTEAIPQLVIKMVSLYIDPDPVVQKNVSFFLSGLSKINNKKINKLLQKELVDKKSSDSNYELLLIRIISSNGNLFNGISPTVAKRFKKILSNRIENIETTILPSKHSHPIRFFTSLLKNVDQKVLIEYFSDEFENVVKNFYSTSSLILSIKQNRIFKKHYLKVIQELAGSSNFDKANAFSRTLPSFENTLSKVLTRRESLQIILFIISAAEWGAFGAEDLRNANFNPISKLKRMAIKYCIEKEASAEKLISKILETELSAVNLMSTYFNVDS